jgi:hypothetical protein
MLHKSYGGGGVDFGRSPSVPVFDGAIMLRGMGTILPAQ